MDYDFNQDGVAGDQLVQYGNTFGWFDDAHVGNPIDTLGMVIDFNMSFQMLFGYNNKKILFRWRNGAGWANFYVQGSGTL